MHGVNLLVASGTVPLVALAVLLTMRAWSRRTPLHFESVTEIIAFLDGQAVDIARTRGVQLDHSIESIESVEQILGALHREFEAQGSDTGIHGLGMASGAYVGEVIRRNYPGSHWERDHPMAGEKSYPIHWEGGESFPMAWCSKRIKNGDEDNIWFKYLAIRQSRARVTPAAGTPDSPLPPSSATGG